MRWRRPPRRPRTPDPTSPTSPTRRHTRGPSRVPRRRPRRTSATGATRRRLARSGPTPSGLQARCTHRSADRSAGGPLYRPRGSGLGTMRSHARARPGSGPTTGSRSPPCVRSRQASRTAQTRGGPRPLVVGAYAPRRSRPPIDRRSDRTVAGRRRTAAAPAAVRRGREADRARLSSGLPRDCNAKRGTVA